MPDPDRGSDQAQAETLPAPSRSALVPLEAESLSQRFHGMDLRLAGIDFDTGPRSLTYAGSVPRFVTGDLIGKGGQGMVFAVHDRDTGRWVALKTMRGREHSPQHIARFVHEAQVTAQLEHPGVVPVHDVNALPDGTLYYTMKRIEGQSLAAIISQRGERALYDLLQIFLRICQTMDFAHAQGVIHRDLKPANIMVGSYGEVLVVDWGLSKVLGSAGGSAAVHSLRSGDNPSDDGCWDTLDGHAVGTPAYMSPEQAAGESEQVLATSDVYALGVILYELLTGRSPYRHGPGRAVMQAAVDGHWRRLSPARDRLPPSLVAIVHKAMAPMPEDRYASAAELAADIDAHLAGRSVSVYRESLLERLLRNAQRHRAAVRTGGTVALVALVVVAAAVLWWRWREQIHLADLRREAGALALQEDWDAARIRYEQIVGRDPGDRVAQEALRADLLRRQEQTRQRLQDALVEEARSMLEQVRLLPDDDSRALSEARELVGEALGRLPQGGAATLRTALLEERDRIQTALAGLEAAAEAQEARSRLPSVRAHLAAGDHRTADRLLGLVESVLPQDAAVRSLRQTIDEAHRQQAFQVQMEQVDTLLASARQARADGRLGDARAVLTTAIELTPGDREPKRLATLLGERDRMLALERAAEEERRDAETAARIASLRERIAQAVAAEDTVAARAFLQQLAQEPAAVSLLGEEEERIAALERGLVERRSEQLVIEAQEVFDQILAGQEERDRQRQEWRRLRARLSELQSEDRAREAVLQRRLAAAEAAIARQAGQVIALLHQARSLADDHPPVRQALADFFAWRVAVAVRRGDQAVAEADAISGQLYDDDGRYALLFGGDGVLAMKTTTSTPLQVRRLVENAERVLEPEAEGVVVSPGETMPLPAGRYVLADDGDRRWALRLDRGQRLAIEAPPAVPVHDEAVVIPAGTIYDEAGVATEVAGCALAVHEITNAAYLQFLNQQQGYASDEALLYPRSPDSPDEALWSRRGNGWYVLRLRGSGRPLDPQAPVTGISIADARAYARWRSQRDGISWRLPTLNEWRLAAQSGDGRRFPWGDQPALDLCYSAYTHDPRFDAVARPVGSFPHDRSVQGVRDLAGSVAEFVSGTWAGQDRFALYCGGSFADREPARFVTTAEGVIDRRQVHPRIGFRLAHDLPTVPETVD